MVYILSFYIFPLAFILDLLLGDPVFPPHPVRLMGNAITSAEPHFRKISSNIVINGGLFAVFLIISAWLITLLLVKLAGTVHPGLKFFTEVIIIFYSISARSLYTSAMLVYKMLTNKKLDSARENLAFIVGRDVMQLSESEVSCAAVETVAENLVDGVISPLFFAAIGGAPLAMAYKMINTLDSMVGYKNDKYIDFGKIAARMDDVANYIPARISVFIVSVAANLLSCKGLFVFITGFKEGKHHSSPNAGYPEAAFAAALGIRLGGPGKYFGTIVEKPYICSGFGKVKPADIKKACELMMISSALSVMLFWLAYICTLN